MTSHSAKRTKATIGLALVLCVLLGVIAWMELQDNDSGKNNETINSIVILRAGHPDIELARQNDQWQMITPYALKVSEQRVDALVQLPRSLGKQYTLAETDLVATGLDLPQAAVKLNDTTYQLGKADLSGDRRYVSSGDHVSLAPEWVWSLVHGGVTAFADLNVFDTLPDALFLSSTEEYTPVLPLNNQALWRSMTADKIVAWDYGTWDYDTIENAIKAESAQHFQLSDSEKVAPAAALAHIFRMEDYSVIQTQPGFAYAISHARLDALLPF